MKIILNGKDTELESNISVEECLLQKGAELDKVVVEYNFEILKRVEWKNTILIEGDKLEVLRFVGGG